MRILCLNGWGGRLHNRLMPYLTDADPDILCLQEVVHTPHANREWLTYRDSNIELPQRANNYSEICAALPGHSAYFCPAAQGHLWDDDRPCVSWWGLATFVRNTVPVIAQSQDFVHGTYSADGFGAHPRSRTAHAVRVFDHAGHGPITVAHMHGLRDLGGKQDSPARLAQAKRFLAMIESVADKNDPVVACGDFNVLPGSRTLGVLGRIGLADLVTRHGFSGTRSSFYDKPERHADYMCVNDRVRIADFRVVREPEVSDHCPLVLDTG